MNPLFINPSIALIELGIKKIVEKINNDATEKLPTAELDEEAVRSELTARALLAQAKVEQELAIARRIDSAEEVEIEEYYDISGKANAGLTGEKGESISFGLGGAGKKVTKRIIKFKGCSPYIQGESSEISSPS
ncbi:hypothetical protein [Halomonas sp.]|uniref:hypothetical protein n=1 Tax=Halomonas sp. TaxID=1486246 RepID=UPI003F8DCBF3